MSAPGSRGGAAQVIWFVRHGETVWNREGRIQGHRDSPLTARGLAQARAAGRLLRELLAGEPPYLLLSSPLGRARRSADLILESIGPLLATRRTDERLKEIAWGRWEGLTRAEIAAREPALWRAHEADVWNAAPPGGESYAALTERARAWLESVRDEPRLIVVGHGAWGRSLRGAWLGLAPDRIMTLGEPQDAIFRLAAGTVSRFSTRQPADEDRR